MPWLLLLHRHLFYRAWIRRLPSYMVLLWSIQPVFSESSVLWSALSSSILFHCTHQATPLASAWVARTVQTGYLNFQLKALHTGRPPHLTDLLQHHQPTKSLRSSSSHQLFIPRHHLSFGSRAFCFSAPRIWNSCLSAFENLSYFLLLNTSSRLTFPVSLTLPLVTHPPMRPILQQYTSALYRFFTCLLTYLLTYITQRG